MNLYFYLYFMDEEKEAQQSAQEHLKWQPGEVYNPYTTCLK